MDAVPPAPAGERCAVTIAAVEDIADHVYARDHGGWAVCYCLCRCGHSWVGVLPGADDEATSKPLECPSCRTMAGRVVSEAEWHRFREPPAPVTALHR